MQIRFTVGSLARLSLGLRYLAHSMIEGQELGRIGALSYSEVAMHLCMCALV